jgi:hypothetical protein
LVVQPVLTVLLLEVLRQRVQVALLRAVLPLLEVFL